MIHTGAYLVHESFSPMLIVCLIDNISKSEVGGENRSEAEVPNRESKPSAHAHATHDTTDQSGAISSGG